MPRELITLQVGQCGNQIGMRFWDLALREHAQHSKNNIFNESMSSFFRNVETKNGREIREIPISTGKNFISQLKARAVIVDMEEGVINSMLKSDIGELFDDRQFISDVSGSGNNWAHGFNYYGPKYEELLLEKIGKAVEKCDSIQSFFLLHSLGGGTGSGVGSYILQLLEDNYAGIFRFTASVFPSHEDDVITSPYNSVLALNELIKHADCVLPIDNQALLNVCNSIENPSKSRVPQKSEEDQGSLVKVKGSKLSETGIEQKKSKPFDKMNNIIAHLLSNLTCSMRFEGILNVDLNEITMNLVPFPQLHFLMSSISPLYSLADTKLQPRKLDQIFKDCYSDDHQLICASPINHKYLAMGLIVRGDVPFSDVTRNIKKMKTDLNMIYWNQEGFKYGICNQPPINQPYSVLCLANNTCIKNIFESIDSRFMKLYKRKAHIHHYTEYIDIGLFQEAATNTHNIIDTYYEMDKVENNPKTNVRIKPLI